jgi:filamentous hemagglutinin
MAPAKAELYAATYLSSGNALPQMGIAVQGATLIKVVPKGAGVSETSGFWMTQQQARAVATMNPEQAGQTLGLPAAQAANILRDGLDFYSITVRSGVTAKVFVSEVAGTTQGTVKSAGGAQQVIVPNRGDWTPAVLVNSVYKGK